MIEAGLEVIGNHGWAAATVRTVCRTAGLTERYFYQAFPDRDALLIAVYDHVVAEGVAVVMDAIEHAPRDFAGTVRAVITAGVDMVTADPRKGRLLAIEATAHQPLLRRRQEAMRDQAGLIARLSAEQFGGRADDLDAQINALAGVGALVEVGSAYLDGRLPLSRERLIESLTGIVLACAGGVFQHGLVSAVPRASVRRPFT